MNNDLTNKVKQTLKEKVEPQLAEHFGGAEVTEITDDGVVVEDVATGETKNVSGELICLSLGSRPNEELIESFRETFEKVLVIGSAVQDGRIHDATKQAYTKGYVFE